MAHCAHMNKMGKVAAALLLLVTLLMIGWPLTAEPLSKQDVRHIAPEALQPLLVRQRVTLIDVRTPEEYAHRRLGLGERLIPLNTLPDRLHELPQDRDAALVFICRTVRRATEAAQRVRAAGWHNVAILAGGVAGWPFPPDISPALARQSRPSP